MLCIDVGIKNLAMCIGDKSGIRHWAVVNLSKLDDTPVVCTVCGKPAKFTSPDGKVCGRHVAKNALWITDQDGKKVDKPTVAHLQAFLTANQKDPKGKKEQLVERANMIATIPMPKAKNMNTFASNTTQVHDAIRGWIDRDAIHLDTVRHVYIEHQPVLKNPVMKTVQILVFCSLRDRFLNAGKKVDFHFVHAGKKIKGETVGDEGYKDRKNAGIDRARAYLMTFPEDSDQRKWLTYMEGLKKKDDVCDTLCMLLDVIG